ncbi:response regulator [Actinokineospora spheciospongiae]|uniref:response regulator n=1 Tax=Actinokineospora spheciospongiae TaxID=909613 RepID=UPI000D718FC6|nr:response regulator transcription factor [Actinokineospora spheciospongiae]PWW60485.1 LuxR family two component transcriptional regulator [Actinokineospora spheciospongiae]
MSEGTGGAAIRVLVVDDQHVVREGLTALLGLVDGVEVVGSAKDGAAALAAVARDRPDVVLMDLRMPGVDGVEATRQITARHPGVAVLVLTTYADDESIVSALDAGARGYLTKDAGRREIAAALRSAAVGQSTFDPAVSQRLMAALRRPGPAPQQAGARGAKPDGLTERELQVVGLIGAGLNNTEIAAKLFIAETTVKTHINNAFAKIGARDRADAVRYAYEHGITGG